MEADRLGGCEGLIVVLDTSIVLDIARGTIPLSSIDGVIAGSYKLVTVKGVLEELSRIAEGGGLRSRIARRALNLVEKVGVVVLGEVEGGVDDAIVALALSLKSRCRVIVATNDRVLRRRLRRIGVPTMYYRRARGGLEVDWHPVF
jgi:rRNA-processing protein FCF1